MMHDHHISQTKHIPSNSLSLFPPEEVFLYCAIDTLLFGEVIWNLVAMELHGSIHIGTKKVALNEKGPCGMGFIAGAEQIPQDFGHVV
jgi:hypothetical protein